MPTTQSLSQQFTALLNRTKEMDDIPSFRVDAQAKLAKSIAKDGLMLSGSLIHSHEQLKTSFLQLQQEFHALKQSLSQAA
jgi:hypothetical protein